MRGSLRNFVERNRFSNKFIGIKLIIVALLILILAYVRLAACLVLSGTFFQTINQLEGGARSTAIFINLLFSVFIGPLLSITCAVGNFLALANLLGNLWILLFQSILSLVAFLILVEDISIQWRTQHLSNMSLGSNGIATFNYEKFSESPKKKASKEEVTVEELFSAI
ncbi:Oidioi.mRNA.OKI2018_I69.PAR.g11817.t1.cds [Oikopleura dioica]|uniref:Oidioi.mRNA.OKI2018_I69.PAR.g11817.t1.cds n=1 Tax=Oikopleura dioica TaxID=34765 RepID=A0ABN7S1R9_OIKDI|nr:Oidioi.mRNA.OKI2018_I69.PAR.g11817.t1.cds [Oikopleura dioica]